MLALFAAVAGGCSDEPGQRAVDRGAARDDDRLVVASFNFPESQLLAEIYAGALEHAGVAVRRELNLGPRELVAPALLQGLVDLVPEYLGTALAARRPDAQVDARDPAAVWAALAGAYVLAGVRVLTPAPGQNQNGIVVTRATAEALGLERISDLARHAPSLRFGGPPECPSRPYCLLGLQETYGLDFGTFVVVEGQERVRRALSEDVIDVGLMFTTDGLLATRDLVLLADDRHLQPAENVVPVVRAEALGRAGPEAEAVIDDVSSRITTTALRFLNWRVSVAGNDPRAEARGWLVRQGLIPRSPRATR